MSGKPVRRGQSNGLKPNLSGASIPLNVNVGPRVGRRGFRRRRSRRRRGNHILARGNARLRIETARPAAARRQAPAQRGARPLARRARPERPFPSVAALAELRAPRAVPVEIVSDRRAGAGRREQGAGEDEQNGARRTREII